MRKAALVRRVGGRSAMPIFHDVEGFGAALVKARRNVEDGVFGQAVAVFGYRTGDVRNIGSAREAAEWLLHELPDGSRDMKARAARQACIVALEGGDAEIARLAFRSAVKEAGSLIGDVDRVYKLARPERSKAKSPVAA
jgi:hypothetical protein